MDTVKTASGKKFKSDYISAIPYPNQLYVRILDTPFADVAAVFSDPKETKQLWFNDIYFAMYTKLIVIIQEPDAVKVCLAKEG